MLDSNHAIRWSTLEKSNSEKTAAEKQSEYQMAFGRNIFARKDNHKTHMMISASSTIKQNNRIKWNKLNLPSGIL